VRLVVVAALAFARPAYGDPSDAGEHAALRDVLGEAAAIVRGSAIETTRSGAFADTQFAVADTLRGDVAAETIVIRQPASEEPLDRGEDLILLLDPKTAEGVYPIHHPAGRYRVENGDSVIVNASGVDTAAVSAKDLRPRAPDERMPLDQFRALAAGPAAAAARADAGATALAPPPPRTSSAAEPAPALAPRAAPEPATPARWPWLVAAVAVGAALLYGVRRARRR